MLLPAILMTTLLCCTQAERKLTADVSAFVAKFRSMNETEDVISGLERLGDDCRELFALGRHVKDLMANFNATGKATDEETNALAELDKLFDHSFMLESFTAKEERRLGSTTLEDVRVDVHTLTNATKRARGGGGKKIIDDVKWTRAIFCGSFYTSFCGADKPMAVLEMVDSKSRTSCRMPTKEIIMMLVNLQDAIRRVEMIGKRAWNETECKEFDISKEEFFERVSSQRMEEHAAQLIEIENLNSTDFNAVNAVLRSGYYKYRRMKRMCLLDGFLLTDESTFNQTSILAKLQLIHKDLLRVQLLEWAMRAVLEVDDEYYDRDAEIVALSIDRTAHFLVKWTRTVQKISWPEIGAEFAKRAIDQEPIAMDAYNKTARKVQKAYAQHCSPSYAYQVLVVPTSEVGIAWSVGSTSVEHYANITNFNGVDIHVFRFNQTEIVARSGKAQKWVKKNEDNILKEMRNGAVTDASSLLSHLQISVDPLYSNDLYGSVIILKKMGNYGTKMEIPIGFALSENASYNLEATRTSYSVINRGRETTHVVKAVFFL